jgi:ketosteroid isomerase-like protein
MRAEILLACLILAAAPAFADPAADAKAHSEAFARAMAARDVTAAAALYTDDARVIWPGQGEEANGKAAITKLIAASLKASPDSSPVLVSQDVLPLGDGLIAVLGQWKQDVKGPDGKVETLHVRSSEILKKTGGKTLYLVDHASIGVAPPPPGAAQAAL